MANNYDRRSDETFGLDDIYDDEMYDDDKLDRVLDEIAEIKKTIQGLPEEEIDDGGYDEVTKLRDEVRFSKTTQKLQDDIRRLNNRINDLAEDRLGEDVRTGEMLESNLDRLSALCEELLRRVKDSDRKFGDELANLKRQLVKLAPSGDLSAALKGIKNDIKNNEEFILNINSAVEGLSARSDEECGDASAVSELIRQLYDVKNLIGNPSPASGKRNDEILNLYDELNKVKYDVSLKSLGIAEKFASVDALAKKIYETNENDIEPVVNQLNKIIEKLLNKPLDRASAYSIMEFSDNSDVVNIPASRREEVRAYLDSVAALVRDGNVENTDDLPDVIAKKNAIQNNRNEFECESVYSSILNINISLLSEKDFSKQKALRADLKKQIRKLTSLEVRDLVDYPLVSVVKPYRAAKRTFGEGLFDKLNELKNFLLDANLSGAGVAVAPSSNSGLVSEINNLKNEIYSLSNIDNVSQAILDLKGDCLTILNKLDEKKERDEEGGIIDGAPTLNEIVEQLDRLFDDVKNLLADTENNILGSVEVIGEAVARFTEGAKADRVKILEDVAFIRKALEGGAVAAVAAVAKESAAEETSPSENTGDVAENTENADSAADTSSDNVGETVAEEVKTDNPTASESGKDDFSTRLETIEENQRQILEALRAFNPAPVAAVNASVDMSALNDRLSALENKVLGEIKLLRDQLFAVSMASVSDGESNSYESYNNIILNEIYALQDEFDAIKEAGETNLSKDRDKIAEELALLKEQLATALSRGADNDSIIKELNKIKEEFKARPTKAASQKPEALQSKPFVVASSKKKKVTPMINKDLSINEILSKISETEIVLKED